MTNKNSGYEYTALYIRAHIHKDLSIDITVLETAFRQDLNSLVRKNIISGDMEKITSNEVELIYDIRFNFAATKLIDTEVQNTLQKIKSLHYVSSAYIKKISKD